MISACSTPFVVAAVAAVETDAFLSS